MVEHLSRSGVKSFLKEALRVLESGGIIRIAVPDLQLAVDKYLKINDADAFMEDILVQAPPISSMKQKFSLLVAGYRHHQWMYDGDSLKKLLNETGFQNAEVCEPGFTKMSDPDGLNLYERSEQSVYVEAIK
jgi:predicted SAM-dependent methyltransferase